MKLYLLTFLRQSLNHPRYFILNLFCLALGIGCSFFLYLFVYKELNTDKFHAKHEDIYKVFTVQKDRTDVSTSTSLPMGPYLSDHLPEVTSYTRVIHREDRPFTYKVQNGVFHNIPLTQVDTSFFKIFDFELLVGSQDEFKSKPNGVFLLPEIANKFFGNDNPVGKTIVAEIPTRPDQRYEFEVIGLLKGYPEEATIRPQILGNIQLELDKPDNMYWGSLMSELYFMALQTNATSISERIKKVPPKKIGNKRYSHEFNFKDFEVKALKDVYFFSANIPGNTHYGDQQLINVLNVIGISILLLVVFNYIILNLGIITSKSQEIKTRRTLGASKLSVLIQYVVNSLFLVLFAFGLVLILYPLIIDILSTFQGYQYSLIPQTDLMLIFWYVVLLLIVGLGAGFIVYIISNSIVPQVNLSNIKVRRNRIYQTLIQFQLVVTIAAIICILFLNQQVNMLRDADLGFDMKNTVIVNVLRNDPIQQELAKLSFVENIAHGSGPFSNTPQLDTVELANKTKIISQTIQSDDKFIETYGISLVEGSNLNPDLCFTSREELQKWNRSGYSNEVIEVLVNQKFVEQAGLKEPIGSLLTDGMGFKNARIVGVMKDFQSFPFYYGTSPVVVGNRFSWWNTQLGVKITPGSKPQLDKFMQAYYAAEGLDHLYSQLVWTYDFEKIYQREITLLGLVKSFTVIILLICCLGLFALNLFISTSRTKEIGIRKVNGAKISEILTLLNKDFVKWVLIAFVIATPISWFAMNQWLENFAYKTELSWWVFALAGLIALGVALLTVSWQSWKAATRNPVEALRYE